MDNSTPANSAGATVNLQTLVSVIQNAVQAQNLIASNIAKLTTGVAAVTTAISAQTAALSLAFPAPLTSSTAWTPGGIANGASANKTITVSGAALGNYTQASLGIDLLGCELAAYVQSANTVEAVINNNTGATVTFTATTLKVRVTAT